jgi:ketosteroid isomerase-like protein
MGNLGLAGAGMAWRFAQVPTKRVIHSPAAGVSLAPARPAAIPTAPRMRTPEKAKTMQRYAMKQTALTLALAAVGLGAGAAHAEKSLTGQTLVDAYGACWEQFNQKNWAEFTKCYSKDAQSTAPGLPTAKGAAQVIEKHAKPIATALPDITGERQLTLASGKTVATIVLMRGTHAGPLAGPAGPVPATNKKIGLLAFHAVESGAGSTAAKEWFIQDNGTMAAQLGLSPQPGRPAIDKGAAERPVVVGSNSPAEQKNLAAAKKLYSLFSKGDKAVYHLLADDVKDHNPSLPAPVVGKAAVTEVMEGFRKMSSNLKVSARVAFAAGDYTVAIGEMTGVNDGDLPAFGIKKTGKAFKLDFAEVLKWQDGKVKDVHPFIDGAQLATQLGLMPQAKVASTK